jgi:hypothetical protein
MLEEGVPGSAEAHMRVIGEGNRKFSVLDWILGAQRVLGIDLLFCTRLVGPCVQD